MAAGASWRGRTGRLDAEMIAGTGLDPETATAFARGSNGFVEAAAQILMGSGVRAERIRTERFGPSGPGTAA